MTIRTRLLLWLALLLLVVLGTASIASYLEGRHELEELFDAQLATSARVLQALMEERGGMVSGGQPLLLEIDLGTPQSTDTLGWLDFGEATVLGHKYEKKLAFQVWDKDGWLIAHSATAPPVALASLTPGYATVRHAGLNGHSHLWRVFTLRSESRVYQVAERDDVRGELAAYVTWQTVGVFMLVAPILLVTVSFVLRRGLWPLELLSRLLRERGPQALTPLALPGLPGELAAITDSINGLFERLDRAFVRERQFAGNAAHELRTPLAALAIHTENALLAANDHERDHSLKQMQVGLARTTRVVEQLLALARVEPMAASGQWQKLGLKALAQQVLEAQLLGAATANIEICGEEREVIANPTLLQLALRNLIDNALRYGPEGGRVEIRIAGASDFAELQVIDQGPGIAIAQRQRVVEPFVRGEGHSQPGSGLGLAIVRQVMELHRGQLLLADNPGGGDGLCVILRFALE